MTAYEFAARTDGTVSLWLQRGGGLDWVTAAVTRRPKHATNVTG